MAEGYTGAFLAEHNSQLLFNVTAVFTVLTALMYILFFICRVCCAEHKWETWKLLLFAYTFNIGL